MPNVRSKDAQLITRLSSDAVGIGNYTTKRDFRRDFDQDMRREGYDYFWPVTSGDFLLDPGTQPFPNEGTSEAITLVHHARRPNGRHTVLVGTKTKLWRFNGTEDGRYTDEDYFEPVGVNAPYAGVTTNQWLLIGHGFSPDGHRWEAIDINGYTCLNNGVDLPMTYRIEDSEVVPIYELREQGIACVGTIGEVSGILMCGDISEIHSEEFLEWMDSVGDISSGNMTASKAAAINQVVTPGAFFDGVAHRFMTIVFADGKQRQILNVPNPQTAGVNGDPTEVIPGQKFTLRNKARQNGAAFSGLIKASVTSGTTTVTASAAFFDATWVGKRKIRFSNGFSSLIAGFTSTTVVTMANPATETIVGLPFWITDVTAENPADPNYSTSTNDLVVADAIAFTPDMVGRYIIFDSGEIRQILKVINNHTVKVDWDGTIANDFFEINNPDSFSAFTDASAIDRIHYRVLWSMPDEPRRFGAIVAGSMEGPPLDADGNPTGQGSNVLTLKFPTKSFEVGQEIIVTGAGVLEGNLIATIASVTALGQSLLLSERAETTVVEQPVEQLDAYGSIVGYEDLQDDSSAILRILNLSDVLVIYKDTCIFQAHFTGDVQNPFDFVRLKMPTGLTLYYRWTLVDVGGLFHVYAGANAFYRFDLSTRVPAAINEMEMVSDLFFDRATLERTDEIFGSNNGVTKEIFFCLPPELDALGNVISKDHAICFDYKYTSASTSSMLLTACSTVRRPSKGTELTEDLFVMGTSKGTVLTYGKSEAAQPSWLNAKQIFYRRDVYPFNKAFAGYQSVMHSGMGDFGSPENVKNLTGVVLYLASQSLNCGLSYKLFGVRNVDEEPRLLLQEYLLSPKTNNLIPCFVQDNYFAFTILIDGMNNPCRIAGHSFTVSVVGSEDHERRP